MPDKSKAETDEQLDHELEDSFPASDPPSMTQPKVKAGSPNDKKTPADEASKRRDNEKDTGAKQRDKK